MSHFSKKHSTATRPDHSSRTGILPVLTQISRKDMPSFLFIAIAGTLCHFLYEWTKSPLAALFCPVSESVWEHLKLLYFPFLFLTLQSILCTDRHPRITSSSLYSRLLAVLCGMLSIITLYYTYTGIIGKNYLFPDILIFLISITVTLRLIPHFQNTLSATPSFTAIYTSWLLLTLSFFLFTCYPPNLPLFYSAS